MKTIAIILSVAILLLVGYKLFKKSKKVNTPIKGTGGNRGGDEGGNEEGDGNNGRDEVIKRTD
tara:strand:+ start:501 stop:689 length:189 start_codon:yes stop_codon:yes gene_type:complete